MRRPTVDEIMTLAPDDASRRAASALAHPGPWAEAGCDARAVWGRCRGSSRTAYDLACDVADVAYRCTCPSQKQPCKHVLALLMLWAGGSSMVPPGAPPAEVAAWLASRPVPADAVALAERVSGQSGGPLATPAPSARSGSPARQAESGAAAARAVKRAERVAAGMAELDLWLRDLLRAGLASAAGQPYRFWDAMAARLVDAQAPAAAGAVRDLAAVPHSGEGWPERLLAAVSRLHLLAAGWARYDRLPEQTQADLRSAAGWPWPAESVLAGSRETDRWYVLARATTDDPQLRVQRTWLWGLAAGRPALIVDFARPGTAFAWQLWPGQVLAASVARYPGSAPLRVIVADQHGDPAPGGRPPGWEDLEAVARARGRALATDPWSERWPVSVRGVTPGRVGDRWAATDRDGRRVGLSVTGEAGWELLALSGGRPLQLLGEWTADAVTPLGAWVEDRMVVL